MKTVRRPRRLVLVVAAAGLALTASGCTYFNPIQTQDFYQAADGTNSSPEGVGVRDAVLVIDEDGAGQLFVTVANETGEDATVSLAGSYDGSDVFSVDVPVAANSTVQVGPDGAVQIPVSGVSAEAGDIMKLTITSGGTSSTISLPVMSDSLGYYPSDAGGQQG